MNQALLERNKRLGSTSEFNNSQDKHDIPQVMPMSDVSMFHLHSEYDTAGDQEAAIDRLMEQIEARSRALCLDGSYRFWEDLRHGQYYPEIRLAYVDSISQ